MPLLLILILIPLIYTEALPKAMMATISPLLLRLLRHLLHPRRFR